MKGLIQGLPGSVDAKGGLPDDSNDHELRHETQNGKGMIQGLSDSVEPANGDTHSPSHKDHHLPYNMEPKKIDAASPLKEESGRKKTVDPAQGPRIPVWADVKRRMLENSASTQVCFIGIQAFCGAFRLILSHTFLKRSSSWPSW